MKYYSHFSDEEMSLREVKGLAPDNTNYKWPNQNTYPGLSCLKFNTFSNIFARDTMGEIKNFCLLQFMLYFMPAIEIVL